MDDFEYFDSSPPILNYSTTSELSSIVMMGTYQPLLENIIIEDETILSKTTNESLSKVMEGLSLLTDGYDVSYNNMTFMSENNEAPPSIDAKSLVSSSGNHEQQSHECSDISPIRLKYSVNDYLMNGDSNCSSRQNDSILGIESTLVTPLNFNKLSKERKYIPLENFEDFLFSNTTDISLEAIKSVDQSLNNLINSILISNTKGIIENAIGITNTQSNLEMDSFFESKIFSSPVMNLSNPKNHNNLVDTVSSSCNGSINTDKNEHENNCVYKNNNIPQIEKQSNILKVINHSNTLTQSFKNNLSLRTRDNKYNSHHKEYTSDSLNNNTNMVLGKNTNFLKSSIKNSDRLETFNQNIDNKHLKKHMTCNRSVGQAGDCQNLFENTAEANRKATEIHINYKDSTKIDDLNLRKSSKIYSTKNFKTCSEIKFNGTEIRGHKQVKNKEKSSMSNNKNHHIEANDACEIIHENNSSEVDQNRSGRMVIRLRKQHNFKQKIKKRLSPFQNIKEENIRKVFHILTSKKTSGQISKKLIEKKIQRNVNNKTAQEIDNIKFRLRKNTKKLSSKSKIKHHVKTAALRKFLTSKLSRSSEVSVLLKCEEVIEKVNTAINTFCSRKTNPINILSNFIKILYKYNICETAIDFYTFVMNYTPFYFQEKILPLKGVFGCKGASVDKLLSESLTDK